VSDLACAIAQELGLSRSASEGLRLAGLIHDIGKIRIPSEILMTTRPLTAAEFEIVKTHPTVGYEVLKDISFPWPIAETVYQHHERLDGSGYPRGLGRHDIILEARILGVADVVEAIASERPYRKSSRGGGAAELCEHRATSTTLPWWMHASLSSRGNATGWTTLNSCRLQKTSDRTIPGRTRRCVRPEAHAAALSGFNTGSPAPADIATH
jgi:putative nucleotidyltransferase with HDIG domain